jgi:hypothetical protein
MRYLHFTTTLCALLLAFLLLRTYQRPAPSNPASEIIALQHLIADEQRDMAAANATLETLQGQRKTRQIDDAVRDAELARRVAAERIERYGERIEDVRGGI